MTRNPVDPSSCEVDDWLVVDSDGSRDSTADIDEQPEINSPEVRGKERGLEASQTQNQILDNQKLQTPASDNNQESELNQANDLLKLLVWHDGLEKPIELVDGNQKPLLVALKPCSARELLKMMQELILVQPQLRGVFPQATRENVDEVTQVCERSGDDMKWSPLRISKKYGDTDALKSSSAAKLQLTSQYGLPNENQCHQLLVESKFEAGHGGELTDWRCGRFYSDILENSWRFELEIGQLVDALDTDKRWYESRIVDTGAAYVKVHYRGWTSKWDEWLRRTSERLAPLHTKVSNWRDFQLGDEILVGSELPGKRYPEWRAARVTACAIEDGSLQIEVNVDGKKKWMDAQDELLCQKGTHKAVNGGAKRDSTGFAAPHSLLVNYFERPEELPPSPSCKKKPVNEVESVREATRAMQLANPDADGDEWCVVDDGEKGGKAECNSQTDTTAVESEVPLSEGSDTDSPESECNSAEQPKRSMGTPTAGQIFTMTTEILNGEVDSTVCEEDAWRYELRIGQLIDARDTDNVWYESRVVALSSTLVKLHYRGWTSKWDEWIERTSTRIAPLYTKVRNWRAFKVDDAVMVGRQVASKRYPEWRNAVVIALEACEVDGRLRIEVEIDGCYQWMDAQDEMLCPPGTHKAVNSSMLKHMVPLF
ncbi:hypothetical protein AM587_10003692 [Phytophthora nicotianae]|uniref:Uncharacterized protein n=1 Tax=Phytophthora nicotianae TaxID=4792 RepID=A0A0W8BVY5_PHYNI|nr:hypothetical protein AM587_10008352 [Phytophthora nicotianae]KUF85053.1 hypothetical protein AM587_10003692 [Phytophthora nicotianae]